MRHTVSVLLVALAIISGLFTGLQPARALTTDSSWNPQSAYCTATVTTIEKVIGSQTNSFGGATYAGGGFKPGIPDKQSLSPPCTAGVPANATFVEIDNVKIPFSVKETGDCTIATSFCDQSFNLQDPSCPSLATDPFLCNLYAEIDQTWQQFAVAPVNPPNSTLIDIQGFVFNETKSVLTSNHNYSPWEIHPLTAWRIAGQTTADFVVSAFHPTITLSQGNSATSTISIEGFNSFRGDVTIALAVPSGLTASLSSTLIHAVSYGQNSNTTLLSVSVPPSAASGTYLLNVTGTSGSLSHQRTVTIDVPFFTMSANPNSKTIVASSSFPSTITVTSRSGFAGVVTITTSISPSGLASQLSRTSLTVAASSTNNTILTVDSKGTSPGVYNITLVGTSGSLSSHVSVFVTVSDFSISASPAALNFQPGSFGVSRIMLTSVNGFVGNITFTASVLPTGPSAKMTLNSLLLKSNTSNQTTVRVDGSTPGEYTLNVTGTLGPLSHSVFVTIEIPGFAVSVIVGQNGALSWNALSAGTWIGWANVGLTSPSSPALCSSSGGRLDLIARGLDNGIYHMIFLNSAWSNATNPAGGAMRDQPACAVLNGLLYLIVRGMDNSTYYNSMFLSTGQWTGWVGLGGFTPSPPVLIVTPSANRLDLIVRGMDNGIYHKAFVSGAWSINWDSPGGSTTATPAAVSDGSILHLVVRGSDNTIYSNSLTFSNGHWQGWSSLSGSTPSAPALAQDFSGVIHLVVRGMNNVLYHKSLVSGVWSAWDSPGGQTPNAPAAVALGTSLALLVAGNDGRVYYNSLSSGTWSGWLGLGGSTSNTPALGIAQ